MSGSQTRPKGPAFTYTAAALAGVLILALVTLSARQTPPPSVAEFAPQAVDQIDDAPSEQSSQFGIGGEGECFGPGCAGTGSQQRPTPTPREIVSRPGLHCIGNRQIEDAQSPPCVVSDERAPDNGGNDVRGVDENSVRVAVPDYDQAEGVYPALFAFFNRRFEFYGRRLVLVNTAADRDGGQGQIVAAENAANVHKVFASTFSSAGGGWGYHRRLGELGVVAVSERPQITRKLANELAPYLWQYPMHPEPMFEQLGRWACERLATRPAVHAGEGIDKVSPRVFGAILHVEQEDNQVPLEPLEAGLSACGASLAVRSFADGTGQASPYLAANAIIDLQTEGVTTVFCLCLLAGSKVIGTAATNQAYFPEWIVTSYILQDTSLFAQTGFPPEQREQMFGLTFFPSAAVPEDNAASWAVRETDPNSSQFPQVHHYKSMLLIASGVQMAGPVLTPETFAKGLQSTAFPNPPHRAHPGVVGFGPGDHSMTTDAAEMWWSNSAADPERGGAPSGAWCYTNDAARGGPGRWPETDLLFKGTCDSGF